MTQTIGVIDEPVRRGASDNLDISVHAEALIDFIKFTNTPITVGIQGEWGSGKTSLINSIYHAFDSDDQTVKQIWINSWEYSLLSTPEEALLKIVNRIIDELLGSDDNIGRAEAIKDGAGKIFRGALRVGAQVALGSEAAKVADELLESSEQSISALRQQLTGLVEDIAKRPSNPFKKVIIYVDDLDRIEPKNAVAILELLKNIFSVPNCVFILAIDYQVVVKGLEHKFGKQTPENEWEFRAFFDKIIQLPFMMPMGQYNIGKYVNSLLLEIGFVEREGLDDEAVREIILRTIGGNPRSIKRLVNSVSLIQIFVEKRKLKGTGADEETEALKVGDNEEKFLLFALLCLQIAYPPIYSLLVEEPDFPKWNDDFAFKQTNRSEERVGDLKPEEMKAIFDDEFKIAKESEDFDEVWEQALYRICYGRPRLKPRVADISKFFSYIKDELLGEDQAILGDKIADVMSKTSVTSVTSTDQGQVLQVEKFKRTMYGGIEEWELQQYEKYENGQIPNNLKQSVEAIKYLDGHVHKMFSGNKNFLMKYGKTSGCTGYSTSDKNKKFIAITYKKPGTAQLELLKDYEHDYRIPEIPKFETGHIRSYDPEKLSTAAHNQQYFIRGSIQDFRDNMEVLEPLINRSFTIADQHKDQILTVYWHNFPDDEVQRQEIIDRQVRLFAPDYKYNV